MATHGILIPNQVFSKHIDSLVRNVKSTTALDNGNVVSLSGISAVSGEREVFLASTPASASPTDLWMIGEPEIVMTNAQYKGLDPDPRNFFIAANAICTAFKPKKFDIITLTAPNFSNTRTTETYVDVSTANTLTWASTSTSATMFKLLEVTTIPLPSGTIGGGRITSYRLECIAE